MGDARMRGWVWCTPRTSCWYNATNCSTSSPPTTHCNLLASHPLTFFFFTFHWDSFEAGGMEASPLPPHLP
ncbi:hypothetical protein HanOQP8_Chr06g0207981 [Helianthus annuus]|nr:hypothetical protein HanHA89_Chr06g0213741 [Helianthus annuus]KAJ0739642.1 hypothetical protein HanOQP8_Chr06g0207981 [Helianthus annuus]